jgi:pyruvate,water dikinase
VTPRIVPLRAIGPDDGPQVGGKAVGLVRLIRAGLPVPDGFVVTCPAYLDQVSQPALVALLRQELAALDPTRFAVVAERIRHAFDETSLVPELQAELATALTALGAGPLAVRSSAVAEDLADASFAGQHDTVLDVEGATAVAVALRQCWASLFSERALGYRARHGMGHDGAIAVVVQRLVPAEAAGVAFSADPLTGERDHVVVSAVRGLGESLVSGRAIADEYVLHKPDGAVLHRRWAASGPALAEARLPELSRLVAEAERAAGVPQDVEWAFADGRLWLLQSRPITGLGPEPVALRDAERPILGYLDRWREVLPGAGTPLLNDLAVARVVPLVTRNLAFHGLVPPFLAAQADGIARIIRGRLYLDLSWFQATVSPGLDELAAADLAEGGQPPPLRAIRPRLLLAMLGQAPRALPRLLRALRQLDVLERESLAAIDRLMAPLEAMDLRTCDDGYLAGILDLAPTPEFERALLESPPANALARALAPPFYTALRWMCGRWAGESEDTAAALVAGLPGLTETECSSALWDLADAARGSVVERVLRGSVDGALERLRAEPEAEAWLTRFQAFLDRFGHRAIEEVELARPRWREQPAYPLSVIASYLGCGPEASPAAVHRRRRQEREAVEARILGRLRWRPLRRAAFRLALEVSQKASAAGENTKSAIMRIFWVMRCAALELGRRRVEAGHLERADDIFFLLRAELLEPRDWRAVVAQRRSEHGRWQREDAPRVIDGRGRPILEGLRRRRPPDADPTLLVGLGSSPGRARGRVRHVPDPACGVSLLPGEVLVAPYTDPAWTPLFVPAAAVVVEIGSLLSHASIVAREMGIPSVVALRGASSLLWDGELVEVDGTQGAVRRLEPGP